MICEIVINRHQSQHKKLFSFV